MTRQVFLMSRTTLFATTALGLCVAVGPFGVSQAQQACDDTLPLPEGCAHSNAGVAITVPAGANTETTDSAPSGDFSATGFSISIDNERVAGAVPPRVPERRADIKAEAANVDVRFDGLDTRRLLNVSTDDLRSGYRAGEQITFRASSNYPAYISRAEVRILDRSTRGKPVVAILPTQPNGAAHYTMPADGSGDLMYVLRVYDAKGRFDETQPLGLTRTTKAFDPDTKVTEPFVAAGEGEDRTRLRNIPVTGGQITTFGTGARPGGTVHVMGEEVPVDSSGRFVVSRILPAGDQVVDVEVGGHKYVRDVEIPARDFFYVGIVDITAGRREDGSINETDTYVDGRIAYYLKGRMKNGWQITSSLDTQEGPIEDLFSRIDDKDPRSVIDRLRQDGKDLYPTYGDDSTYFDDTPTRGNVYLRLENETTRFTWGNYTAGLNSGGLVSNTRSLYGAEIRYQTPSVTTNGDPRATVQAYAASPDTAAQRDILRGTGGSVYFLSRQDISHGSVVLNLEVVDPITGRVISSQSLSEGADYQVDHIQGVLLLNDPVGSAASDGLLIRDGTGEYDVNLVAQYEYTPVNGVDINAYGGRAEAWLTDRLRFGVTVMRETTDAGDDQDMAALDLRYELSDQSYAELEYAETDGPGLSRSESTDGGLTISSSGGVVSDRAGAVRFDSHFDLTDLGLQTPGYIGLYYERKEAGFSTLREDITSDQSLIGLEGAIEVSDRLRFSFELEDFDRDNGDSKQTTEVNVAYQLNPMWAVEGGLRYLDQVRVGDPTRTGERTDAAVKLTYTPSDDLSIYAFGQGTLDNSGGLSDNNRIGIGFDAQLSEKVALAGEASGGSTGGAGALRLTYTQSADREFYFGYSLDPVRTDSLDEVAENGTVVFGGRYRINDRVSTYAENNIDLPGASKRSLTRAYGVTYTPTDLWSFSGSFETGDVRDDVNGDFDRTAVSFGAAYSKGDVRQGRVRLEYRVEDGDGTARDRDTITLSADYANKVTQDWRFLMNLDAHISDSDESDFRDGEYVRFSLGAAYRPIDNERLNMLFRYTLLRDLPGEDQVTAAGSTDGPEQRSHVLSANVLYDLSERLTIGGKIGYRESSVADRGTNVFTDNTATLAALRLDWHVVSKWDVMGEVRVLETKETDTTETGALVGVYRHVGNNAKVGIGYEWGEVSDDLTDLDYTNRGLFLNVIAKF